MTTAQSYAVPESICHAMLRLTPINVVLFDTNLVCQYAAPVGDLLLGQVPQSLIGRAATDVLPPAANGLAAPLRDAAAAAASWHHAEYRFALQHERDQQACCWSISIEPLVTDDYRGVLVTWSDILEAANERATLLGRVAALEQQREERASALTHLLSDLRNLITPVSGYLQVMARRPAMLAGRPFTDVITTNILPRIDEILTTIDRVRHPPIADTD